MQQGFGSGGTTWVASVRRCQNLPLCLTESMPPGFRMDPLLNEGDSISDGGSAPGLANLRRGKICCATPRASGKRNENMWNTSAATLQAPRISLRAEISLKPMVQTMMRQLCPSSPWKCVVEHKSTCSFGGSHSEAGCWVRLMFINAQV